MTLLHQRRGLAPIVALAVLLSGCGADSAKIELADHGVDDVILQLDSGSGNVEPEEAALDRIEVIVLGDGRLFIQGEDAGTIDQATLNRAVEELGAVLAMPEESQELADRILSDNDDGPVATITAIVDSEAVNIRLPGLVHSDRGTAQEVERAENFRRNFAVVADPGFWDR